VNGNVLTVLWNGSNFANVDASQPGDATYVRANEATQLIYAVPVGGALITREPSNQTVDDGGTATFTVAAIGTPVPTLQWQVSVDNGSNWNDLSDGGVYSGVTTATLTITGASPGMNLYQYRCLATNSTAQYPDPSFAATLTVAFGAPGFSSQPSNQTVTAGETVAFTGAATGTPTPELQWQVSTDGGGTWNNLADGGVYSGSMTGTLTITGATLDLTTNQYRCVAANPVAIATSNAAALTVVEP
jgi:hypothetical protein